MAIENCVILKGKINRLNTTWKNGEPVRMEIALTVLRRPNSPLGNRRGKPRYDDVPILVRDQKQMQYLSDEKAAEGDLLEVSGVYNTVIGRKRFFCGECGKENFYDGSVAYVTPISMDLKFLHPKEAEIVTLTKDEAKLPTKQALLQKIRSKMRMKGEIIDTETLGKNGDGEWEVRIVSQEKTTDEEVRDWMFRNADISNRVYLMGNLCSDPRPFTNESGGKSATYQIGINRKYYVKEDSPETRADYPFIKSVNAQAESDAKALQKGSLVFIDGAIQKRDGFTVEKVCAHCGAKCDVNGNTLEVVPYAVEYLRGCTSEAEISENYIADVYIDEDDPAIREDPDEYGGNGKF